MLFDRNRLSRYAFTHGQWATALAVALLLHGLLAWLLCSRVLFLWDTPVGQGASLTVVSLSLSGADPPVLKDITAASPERVTAMSATPVKAVSQPVLKPASRPMTEVLAARSKRQWADKPTPNTQRERPPTRDVRKSSPPRMSDAEGNAEKGLAVGRAEAGDDHKGAPLESGAVNVDRAVTPVPGNARPRYPRLARRRGQEGRVLIRISVLGNGRVGSAAVASSSGYSALDRAALTAVKGWRFKPALRAGSPVTVTLTVPVVFQLEG